MAASADWGSAEVAAVEDATSSAHESFTAAAGSEGLVIRSAKDADGLVVSDMLLDGENIRIQPSGSQ